MALQGEGEMIVGTYFMRRQTRGRQCVNRSDHASRPV